MDDSYNTYNTYNPNLQKSLLGKLLDSSLEARDGLGHRHVGLAARSVVVATTLEVATRKEVDIHRSARAQRHTDEILVLDEDCRYTLSSKTAGIKATAVIPMTNG